MDIEILVIHVRRSVVMMVQGSPKTEASAKDVPFDSTLAESLRKLKMSSPYDKPSDWVFASPKMNGMQPYWPKTLWRRQRKDLALKERLVARFQAEPAAAVSTRALCRHRLLWSDQSRNAM